MPSSSPFVIPIVGLSEGEHKYSYVLNDVFFENFENTPVKSGRFEVDVMINKKSNHLELNFDISGVEHTVCDRCLADIDLPVTGSLPLIVKYDSAEREEDEVVYISYNQASLDLSKYIYEFICLQVPMVKLYNCDHDPAANCNMEVLNKLNEVYEMDVKEEIQTSNPFAETLKNLKL